MSVLFTDGLYELTPERFAQFALLCGVFERYALHGRPTDLWRTAIIEAYSLQPEAIIEELHRTAARLGLVAAPVLREWLDRQGLEFDDVAADAADRLAIRRALQAEVRTDPDRAGLRAWRGAALLGEAERLGWLWGSCQRAPRGEPGPDAMASATECLRRWHGTVALHDVTGMLASYGVPEIALADLTVRLASAISYTGANERPPTAACAGIQPCPKRPGDRVRSVSPEDTWARIAPHLERIGVTRVADVTGLDQIGLPVFTAVRPASTWSITVHAGKGVTAMGARVGACAEAIECWRGERHRNEPILASYQELSQRAEVLDPFDLMLPPESTYHPDRQLAWVDSVDLVSGKTVMVPLERVVGAGSRVTGLRFTSNGQAAGNTYEEAVCHALAELIERDSTASQRFRWMEMRTATRPPPLVPIETLPDEAKQIVARFTAAELTTHVLDMTTDLGIPVFVAVLVPAPLDLGPDGQISGLCAGSGAHPDREVALLRALTEAAQTHAVIVQGAREDLDVAAIARAAPRSHKMNELGLHSRHGRFALLANSHRRSFEDIETWPSTNVADDVRVLVERLLACGMRRVLIVDLGDSDTPLAVVRAIVPGLQDLQESSFTWRARRALWSK